jgi:hypothetical protein
MGLSKRKRAFISAYCEDPKIGQADAARKAGYSIKRSKQAGYELMRDPDVKREIDRHLATKVDRVEILAKEEKLTPETVIRDLDDIAEMCKSAGPGAWQASTLVKVAELKGKYLKMFTDKIEVGPTEALMELLLEGRKRAGLSTLQGKANGNVQ